MPQFYLSRYVGTGTYRDPFRPELTAPGWSAISLRPDPSIAAGRCLVALPTAAGSPPAGTIDLGDGGSLSVALRTQLGNALGVTLTQNSIDAVVAEILIDQAGGSRWKSLQPRIRGDRYRWEIYLGGPLWSKELPVIAGGASVSDSFTRADSTTVGGSWVEDLADWSIASNALTNNGIDDAEIRYNSSLDTADHYAQSVINAPAFRGAGVLARHAASSAREYYVASVFGTTSRELHVRTSGSYTQLAAPVTPAITFPGTIRIECQGSTIRALWNGVVYSQATDTTWPSYLQTGIYQYNAQSLSTNDDFAAADLTTPGESGAYLPLLPVPLQPLQFVAPVHPVPQSVPPVTLTVWAGADGVASFSGSAAVAETVTITSTGQGEGTASRAETATLTAAGTVAGTASVAETVTIAATGSGSGTASVAETVSIAATGGASGTASSAVTVSITAAGALTGFVGSAAVAETATITATGGGVGTASRSVTTSLTATGTGSGAATVAETVTISSAGALTGFVGSATVAETVSITAVGTGSGTATEAVTVGTTASGTAVGSATRATTVTITATGALTTFVGSATVTETVAITAAGTAAGSASVAETVSITATGSLGGGALSGTASVAETVGITSAGQVSGAASVAETASVTATGATSGTASRSTSVTITASGQVGSSATVAETVTLTAAGRSSGSATRATTVTITAAGVLQATGSANVALAVSITATGHIVSAAEYLTFSAQLGCPLVFAALGCPSVAAEMSSPPLASELRSAFVFVGLTAPFVEGVLI